MLIAMNRLDSKLIFWTSLLTIVIIAAYSVFRFPDERRALMKQMDRQGGSLTYAISRAAVGPILYHDHPALQTLAESLIEKDNSVSFIRIRLASEGNALITEEYASTGDASSRVYREEIKIEPDFVLGSVEIGILTAPTEALIAERLWGLIVASVLLILIKIITVFIVLARMVRRPLRKLSGLAQRLGQGDLSTAITLPGRDELVLLAETLDGMRLNLRESYDAIQIQNAELQELDRMKDDFLANVTHELKTPLNGILGLGNAIRDDAYGAFPEAFQKPMGQIVDSATRLLKLTNQLIAFSRDGKKSVKPREISLRAYLKHLLERFEYPIQEKGIAMDLHAAPDLVIRSDPELLDMIFMNLVGNAVKFTQEGHVAIHAQTLGTQAVAVSVEDTGVGIPEAVHAQIFDRFQQGFASENRTYEGSGLGLAIVAQALSKLDGAIHLKSTPEVGSTFTVLLPRQPGLSEDALRALWETRPRATPPTIRPRPSTPAPRDPSDDVHAARRREESDDFQASILVVDDDPINLEVVSAVLRRQCDVAEAESGGQCLEMIGARRFDLVLLDLMMPNISGFDVLAILQEMQAERPTPPIIVLSAKDQITAITRAFRLGAVDYVTKPFHRDELLARIRAHIQLSRAKQAVENANRAKSEFLGTVSHELRTPMNIILGLSQLLQNNASETKRQLYLAHIRKAGDGLVTIIDDILEISRLSAGQIELIQKTFSLEDFIRDTADILCFTAEKRRIDLEIEQTVELSGDVVGDPYRLRQVLVNLLGNAIKFTERGTVKLHVSRQASGRFVFTVSDTGIGIPEEKQEMIFQAFTQVDSSDSRGYGGVGLGLSICQRLVQEMGGTIRLQSEPGRGSVFSFTVPLTPAAQLDA